MANKEAVEEEKKEKTEINIEELYTPLSVAKEEIQKRWNNKELKKKVENFLGGDVPGVFKYEPRAVLARHITTPNLELSHFIELASLIKLKPINLEYLQDKYLSCNPFKLCLGKICFFEKSGNNGEGIVNHEHIIDFVKSENVLLKEIKTLKGESLVDFHHKILKLSRINIDFFDISEWYIRKGARALKYMKYYLALFICNGVLFENYLTCKNEGRFTSKVVLPALREIKKIFGVKPLIVPIMPPTVRDEVYWRAYPSFMKKYI